MPEGQRTVFFIFSGLLGLTIGSFLNVCIFRLPRNCMSIVKPRSRCPKCLNWIAWYDNLPVVSWLLLLGRCRRCKNPISIRYTLVELMTGALFLFSGYRALYGSGPAGWPQAARFAVEAWFLSAMIVCTFIDLEFRIIPDEVSLSGIAIGLLASLADPLLHPEGLRDFPMAGLKLPAMLADGRLGSLLASAAGALAGGGAVFAVGVLGKILFRKRIEAAGEEEAMGLGDVKFMSMVGSVLGWRGVLFTFLIACLLGSIFGIGRAIVTRRMGYVPFGPFLAAGAVTMLFASALVDHALRAWIGWLSYHPLIDNLPQ